MQEDNVNKFLDIYRELEDCIKVRYNVNYSSDGSSIRILKKQREFRPYKNQIDLFKDIRNLLSHEPKTRGDYPIIPTRGLIGDLEALKNRVKNPPRVDSIMIGISNVCSVSKNDFVRPVIKTMIENAYTHIPILDDGRVIGVFSENTLLSLFANEEIVMIDDDLMFNDEFIGAITPLDRHVTESFRFVSKNTTVFEVREQFAEAVRGNDRIGLAFITQNGKPGERLLGIISSWDLPQEEIADETSTDNL